MVWAARAAHLPQLDIGTWFGARFAAERTPTLRQALELARGRSKVVVELKYYGHAQALEERVARVIEETGMTGDIQVMSLKLDGVRRAQALRPGWRYGLLSTASVGDLSKAEVQFLAVSGRAARRSLIRRAHDRGLKVYVWTINDPIRMSVMVSRGVDGIITDEPATARRLLELRRELSPLGRLIVWIAGEAGMLGDPARAESEGDA
jgi:glycerophosphoryl diester phosphodiesterase